MYRALISIDGTHASLVFKPLPASNARFPGPDEEFAIDNLPNPANALAFSKRWDGATNSNAGLNSKVANIGNPQSTPRTAWKDLLDNAYLLLKDLVEPGDHDFGSHPNPARLDPDSITLDEVGSGLEAPVKAGLESFRTHYTSGISQPKKDEYYAIAYAETRGHARHIYPFSSFANLGSSFNYLDRRRPNDGYLPHRPWEFTFHQGTVGNHEYSKALRYCATRIVIRIFAIHNALYGSDLMPLGTTSGNFEQIKTNRTKFHDMLKNIEAAFMILADDIVEWNIGYDERLAAWRDAEELALASALDDLNFSVHKLTDSAIYGISINPKYNEYFTTTFNQDIITIVPIIHNLYLTEQYFEDISTVLLAPKIRALDTLIEIITEDKDFNMKPNMERPATRQAIAAANGDHDFGPFLQDLIIKILIETPINILKGLAELIDPHIAITKMIKTGSMIAFAQGAKILDGGPADSINDIIKEQNPDSQIKVTGEGLMGLIVCMMEAGFTLGDMGIEEAMGEDGLDPPPINFFPTATLKGGIDFTGTVSGMVMAPPLPLGLLYLLLELIKNALNQTENLDVPPRETGCEDDEGEDNT